MGKVQVTAEMKERILFHLQNVDLTKAPHPKAVRLSPVKKYLSLAACLAILLTGTFTLLHLFHDEPVTEPPDGLIAIPNTTQAASAEELSELVGFDVVDIADLPFQVEETTYTSYWGELAEIRYQGDGQTATFRKSAGSENNSGDYTAYSKTDELQVGGATVTLKGDGETYTLAIWFNGAYAYSLKITNGMAAETWEALISSMIS